ncbi:MAG: response regulator transcription factor [Flavobacteriia bacterium]|nr:response regulator transcription factor [Flavobacteriia bacterium]OJX36808.1 MAG: DNA-binding response regulator [Flavobacteriia bacterium 40-80]
MRILIIDDEIDILNIIQYTLVKQGFEVDISTNGKEGIDKAKKNIPDLVILDVMMPEMDGIEVCEILRSDAKFDHTVITFLTARGEDFSQIAGLDAGADDYITKPIKPNLLISRVNALLRRKIQGEDEGTKNDILAFGDLIIDKQKYQVNKNKEELHLPKKEFELLYLLATKPNYVFERDFILNTIWGTDIVVGDRTIDVHIRKLREKIGSQFIKTVKGIGYKFVSE